MIILLFCPSLVKNIFICVAVAFCASSRIITASFNVRPLMNAKGAISIIPLSSNSLHTLVSMMSFNESSSGMRYGFIFSIRSPGRKPRCSPASTAGLTKTIFLTSPWISAAAATATAKYVFPVPAGPRPKVMMLSFMPFRYAACPTVLGFTSFNIGFSVCACTLLTGPAGLAGFTLLLRPIFQAPS